MSFWCDAKIVVAIEGPEGPSEIVVPRPFARIGSHPESDVILPEAPKRALYLHAVPDGLYCLDLDVEEGALESHDRWLGPDSEWVLGPYRLRARLEPEAGGAADQRVAGLIDRDNAPPPLPVINVFCGKLLKDKRRFKSRLSLVGRRPQCALRLRGYHVSSYHCALFWHERRLWCIDLNSSNGTQLNDERIDCAEVQRNDRLDVGEFRLVYYRWSPRNWQEGAPLADTWQMPAAAENRPVSQAGDVDAGSYAATIRTDEDDETATPSADREQHAKLAAVAMAAKAELEQEVARLAAERERLQAEWEADVQRRQDQIERLQAEAERLAAERESLVQARQQWESERGELAQQLSEQTERLTTVESELARVASPVSQAEQDRAAAAVEMLPPIVLPPELARVESALPSPEAGGGDAASWNQGFESVVLPPEIGDEPVAPLAVVASNEPWYDERELDDAQPIEGSPETGALPADATDEEADEEAELRLEELPDLAPVAELPPQNDAVDDLEPLPLEEPLVEELALEELPVEESRLDEPPVEELPVEEPPVDELDAELDAAPDESAEAPLPESAEPSEPAEEPELAPLAWLEELDAEAGPPGAASDAAEQSNAESEPEAAMESPEPQLGDAEEAFALAAERDEEASAEPLPAVVAAPRPVGRRPANSREEVPSFDSSRLVEREGGQRRRRLIIWSGAIAAAVGVAAAAGFAAWQFLL